MQGSAFCLVLWIAKTLGPRVAWSDRLEHKPRSGRAPSGVLYLRAVAARVSALRAYCLGSLVRISEEDLAAFLAAHREP
jgi:hypothetical protein